MDRHDLFFQVALHKRQESFQRNRDIDIKASALLGFTLAAAGVLALMVANRTELMNFRELPDDVWAALLVFAISFVCACYTGWAALRLRTWDAQPSVKELAKHVTDPNLNDLKLIHWTARSYLTGDEANKKALRGKGRAYNAQLTASVLLVVALGYVAICF